MVVFPYLDRGYFLMGWVFGCVREITSPKHPVLNPHLKLILTGPGTGQTQSNQSTQQYGNTETTNARSARIPRQIYQLHSSGVESLQYFDRRICCLYEIKTQKIKITMPTQEEFEKCKNDTLYWYNKYIRKPDEPELTQEQWDELRLSWRKKARAAENELFSKFEKTILPNGMTFYHNTDIKL